jgi:autotransporter adhesin
VSSLNFCHIKRKIKMYINLRLKKKLAVLAISMVGMQSVNAQEKPKQESSSTSNCSYSAYLVSGQWMSDESENSSTLAGTDTSGNSGSGGSGGPPPHYLFTTATDEMDKKLKAHASQLEANFQALDHSNKQLNKTHTRILEVGKRVHQLEQAIQRNDKKARQGIAAVAALGSAVLPSAPGKTVIGAGVGHHDGVQGVAINVSHRPEAWSQVSFQGGIGASAGGRPAMRLGASYEF